MVKRVLATAAAVLLALLFGVRASGVPAEASIPPRWQPTVGQSWQWQLSGALDLTVAAGVYDVDAVTTSAATVAALHKAGRKAVCYINVGAREDWRADASRFPAAVIGADLDGWSGERWLDIRRWDVLQPILADRFAACRQKGFDGVEPDNVDGYDNDSGFPLTAADQLTFNRRIADLAHGLGLAVALKNDLDQVAVLAPAFDFAVNEECVAYAECGALKPFIAAGKPVFHVEYDLSTAAFCPTAKKLGFSSMRKRLSLNAWRQAC
jgi:hypothetical protein